MKKSYVYQDSHVVETVCERRDEPMRLRSLAEVIEIKVEDAVGLLGSGKSVSYVAEMMLRFFKEADVRGINGFREDAYNRFVQKLCERVSWLDESSLPHFHEEVRPKFSYSAPCRRTPRPAPAR